MVKLHVFNPEHDLALAADLSNFTAPHAGRQLRADLGYILALWAGDDDLVLVENVEDAEWRYRLLTHRPFGRFLSKEQIARAAIEAVEVWGWDKAVCTFLLRHGVAEQLLPSVDQLDEIRKLSHRRCAQILLAQLQVDGTTGEALYLDSLEMVLEHLNTVGKMVVKAPWSSSGRGVRFLEGNMNCYDKGWARNIIDRQGSIMIEPYYNKVKDFGMEFESDGEGHVTYLGLSLFHTSNGAYTGNVLADEEDKLEMISHYIPVTLLDDTRQRVSLLTGDFFKGKYKGPFGIDMMIVAREDKEGFLLHPCVEINLRRTMGHVALSLTRQLKGLPMVMNIEYDKNIYKLKLRKL
ncbi:MAG: hypothetical protein IJ067_06740 [Prevotella sp.]|nr:hypothetical protein [Prevotella sp.]